MIEPCSARWVNIWNGSTSERSGSTTMLVLLTGVAGSNFCTIVSLHTMPRLDFLQARKPAEQQNWQGTALSKSGQSSGCLKLSSPIIRAVSPLEQNLFSQTCCPMLPVLDKAVCYIFIAGISTATAGEEAETCFPAKFSWLLQVHWPSSPSSSSCCPWRWWLSRAAPRQTCTGWTWRPATRESLGEPAKPTQTGSLSSLSPTSWSSSWSSS